MQSEHLSVVIDASPERVFALARAPHLLPRWAAGLAQAQPQGDGENFVVASPMGEVRVRFAESNTWGVLDHEVELPDGTLVHNPMRVLPHPDGSEVVFTLRQLGMTDAEFARDAAMVRADLERLKHLVESDVSAAAPAVSVDTPGEPR